MWKSTSRAFRIWQRGVGSLKCWVTACRSWPLFEKEEKNWGAVFRKITRLPKKISCQILLREVFKCNLKISNQYDGMGSSSSIYTSQNTRPNKSLLPESSANNLSDTSSLLPPSLPEFQSSVLNGDSHCPLSSHLPLMGPSSELKQRSTTPARIEWLVEWAAFRKGLSLSTVHQQQSNILSQVEASKRKCWP